MDFAREGKFTTYGALADANGIPWQKARYFMSGAGGHLVQLPEIYTMHAGFRCYQQFA